MSRLKSENKRSISITLRKPERVFQPSVKCQISTDFILMLEFIWAEWRNNAHINFYWQYKFVENSVRRRGLENSFGFPQGNTHRPLIFRF